MQIKTTAETQSGLLEDDQLISAARDLMSSSYTSARPRGLRALPADDLLALAKGRFGEQITEQDVDEAVSRVGGHKTQVTSTRDLLANRFRWRQAWWSAYLIPAQVFGGLDLPPLHRTPRRPRRP